MGTMTDWRKQAIAGLVPPQTDEAMIRETWPSVAAFPAVAGIGKTLTELAAKLARTVILLPVGVLVAMLGWLLMGPIYFMKLLPAVVLLLLPLLIAIPIALVLGFLVSWILAVVVAVPLIGILFSFFLSKGIQPVPFLAKRYTLTNRRLMVREGLRPVPTQEVLLADVDEIRIHKDVNSDFFRAATLEVISKGQAVMRLPGVREPEGFRHAVDTACQAWVPGRAGKSIIPGGDRAAG
jgi:hypothetical protein